MNTAQAQLHCGACMENFLDTDSLNTHLENCAAAKALLPAIHYVSGGEFRVGHPISSRVYLIHKHHYLIKKYAYAVADELCNIKRAEIHCELCEKLHLNYKTFKPFEGDDIKKQPNREEALNILFGYFKEWFEKEIREDVICAGKSLTNLNDHPQEVKSEDSPCDI
jgi:hypothetical protein